MNYKLYVVTADGYIADYGSYIYLIGVYNNEKDAQKAANEYIEQVKNTTNESIDFDDDYVTIKEINMNETHPLWLEHGMHKTFENELFLGGYAE